MNSLRGLALALFAVGMAAAAPVAYAICGAQTVGSGGIILLDPQILTCDASVTATGSGGFINFASTVDGGFALETNTSGAMTFGDAVGSITPLTTLDASGAPIVLNGSVTSSGTQTYNGSVALGADATLASTLGTVNFNSSVNGNHNLVVISAGTLSFNHNVGDTTPLRSLNTNSFSFTSSADVTVNDNLSVTTTSNGIFQSSGALAVDGTSTFDAGSNAILLGNLNSLYGAISASGSSVSIANAGPLSVANISSSSALSLSGPSVTNSGTLSFGTGSTVGTISGNFTQASSAGLTLHASATNSDQLAVSGDASLDGTLSVAFSATPALGQTFSVLTASAITGAFATTNVSGLGAGQAAGLSHTSGSVVLTIVPAYTIGGSISGSAGSVELKLVGNNPSSTQSQAFSNGNFSFGTALPAGSGWSVTVATPPSDQICSVSNGSGSNLSGNVGNVSVNCANAYVVTASAPGGHGTISPASQTVTSGSTVSFTLTPNAGFEVASVTGDTCTVTQQNMSNTWVSSAITQGCAVTAVFADYPSQCSGATNFTPTFFDDFSGTVLDPEKWTANANNGSISVVNNAVSLSAPNGPTFPYVTSVGSPIPATGAFSVRWIATYTAVQGAGTGSLALSNGVPANGADHGISTADAWQDIANGYRVEMLTTATNQIYAYQQLSPQVVQHDVEYCWLQGISEVWVDGMKATTQTRDIDVPQPDSLWFGNPVNVGAAVWTPLTLYYVEVRALNDRIFADGFDTP